MITSEEGTITTNVIHSKLYAKRSSSISKNKKSPLIQSKNKKNSDVKCSSKDNKSFISKKWKNLGTL